MKIHMSGFGLLETDNNFINSVALKQKFMSHLLRQRWFD